VQLMERNRIGNLHEGSFFKFAPLSLNCTVLMTDVAPVFDKSMNEGTPSIQQITGMFWELMRTGFHYYST
jgi:hypothetical protein